MSVQAVEKRLILPEDSVQAAQAAAETLAGGPEQAALFKEQNPSFGQHRLNVGGALHWILVKAGVSQELQELGTLMGVAHDDGKEGLGLENDTVWSPDKVIEIRREHTHRGLVKTLKSWHSLPNPGAIAMARFRHHSEVPKGYETFSSPRAERWALVHGIIACDRLDAATRAYAQQTGAGLDSPQKVIKSWVIKGRPHAIPNIMKLRGIEIDLGASLLSLLDVRPVSIPEQRQDDLVMAGSRAR